MLSSVAALIAILCYLSGAILQYLNLTRTKNSPRSGVMLLGGVAVCAHLVSFPGHLYHDGGLDLGIFNMVSLISWLVAALSITSCIRKPLQNVFVGVFPLAAIGVLLSMLLSSGSVTIEQAGIRTTSHILLSLFAYSTLTLAAIQAILLAIQEHHLRHQLVNGLIQRLPPLQLMEQLFFEFIWIGVVLLSCSILTGVIFINDLFAQHLAHKTILSIVAWLIFTILLFGRYGLGWRGSLAIRLAIGGYVLLALAYFGTKLVLEIILS